MVMTRPVSTPAGILTLTLLFFRTLPLPLQVEQGVLIILPRPPHWEQVVVDCICIPMKLWVTRSWPVPWQREQVSTTPSALPLP